MEAIEAVEAGHVTLGLASGGWFSKYEKCLAFDLIVPGDKPPVSMAFSTCSGSYLACCGILKKSPKAQEAKISILLPLLSDLTLKTS